MAEAARHRCTLPEHSAALPPVHIFLHWPRLATGLQASLACTFAVRTLPRGPLAFLHKRRSPRTSAAAFPAAGRTCCRRLRVCRLLRLRHPHGHIEVVLRSQSRPCECTTLGPRRLQHPRAAYVSIPMPMSRPVLRRASKVWQRATWQTPPRHSSTSAATKRRLRVNIATSARRAGTGCQRSRSKNERTSL